MPVNNLVDVPLPLNISCDEKYLYQPYCSYSVLPVKVKKITGVFLSGNPGGPQPCYLDNACVTNLDCGGGCPCLSLAQYPGTSACQ